MNIPRFLIVFGIASVALGFFFPYLQKLGLGNLPGDIYIRRNNFSFYFPIATCLVISGVLWLVGFLLEKLR